MDILILNTGVLDLRNSAFTFARDLAGPGGLAKCETRDLPDYSQDDFKKWIAQGFTTVGGPGNTAPLVSRAGLTVGAGCNLGSGSFDGLDVQGRTFYDVLAANNVDMSSTVVHPNLPTGMAFIYEAPEVERGSIAYFPNANNDFSFEHFKGEVSRHQPDVVYYMYSGLSDRGDANNGQDLADFIAWCRQQGCITIVDSHTLCTNPQKLIEDGQAIEAYRLLLPLLPEVDIFFTSADEARMIGNSIDQPGKWKSGDDTVDMPRFLEFITRNFADNTGKARLFGVTVSRGAYASYVSPDGQVQSPTLHQSRFMAGEVIDLVGAGDSFRAGLITYIAQNKDAFQNGLLNTDEAAQMGNLMASLYIKAPLDDRYGNIKDYTKLLQIVQSGAAYNSFDDLTQALRD